MHKIKIRSKRQLDARNAADEAVLALRARKARGETGLRAPTPEEIERFAVGGCGGGCQPLSCTPTPVPCRSSSLNDCYHEVANRYGCPLKVVSGGQLNIDGQNRIAFRVEPAQSNYFLPISVRLSARSREDPGVMLVWRLTAVMVKNQPQENYHEPTPGPDTVVGVESVAYDGRTAGDVPAYEIGWGPFSRSAMADHLELVGWNPYPVGTVMTPRAEIWGYPIDTLPEGWKCGTHPGRLTANLVGGDPTTPPPRTPLPVP